MATALSRATVLACALLASSSAAAQEQAQGFALNRFEPSERGSDWFVAESLDLRGHQRTAFGLVVDHSNNPLVLYDEEGNEEFALVSDQLFAHVGGAINLWDRFRLALDVPVAVWQDGQEGQAGNVTVAPSNDPALGDLRITIDVRALGEYGDPITVAGGIRIYAPTGSQDAFTGDGAFRGAVRALGAGRIASFVYGAGLGFELRGRDEAFAGTERGNEVGFNAAAGAILMDDKLVIGPEIFGATVVSGSDAVFSRTETPVEAILGGHYRFHPDWQAGLGGGTGLTRGFGTPQFRTIASLVWFEHIDDEAPAPPPPPPPDRDGDGILDRDDACPDEPGVETDDPATNGCPPPEDSDGDGIFDDVDACPDRPGVAHDDPKKHGCPPPGDRDGDTVIDPEDACPDTPGIVTEDPKTNGCPDPDRDQDGIVNEQDACPDDPGEPNEDPKKNGCPVARVVDDQIVIREQVQFAYNSDQLLKASDTVLNAVREILEDNPHIQKVSVEGHTDSKGSEVYNKRLSDRRAASVVKWLVKNGIDKSRLDSVGHGEAKPIADNETEEGRANNRRVEFRIVEQAAPAPPAPEKPATPAAPAEPAPAKPTTPEKPAPEGGDSDNPY